MPKSFFKINYFTLKLLLIKVNSNKIKPLKKIKFTSVEPIMHFFFVNIRTSSQGGGRVHIPQIRLYLVSNSSTVN